MNKYIYIILLAFILISCSTQKQQMSQFKKGLKNAPKHNFINLSELEDARQLLLEKIENFALGNDTIIIEELFTDVFGAYSCTLYTSNTGEIKRYSYVSDNYNESPIICYLKDSNASNITIEGMNAIRTDLNSYIKKIESTKMTPSTDYFITIAIKIDNKYVFQYFSATD